MKTKQIVRMSLCSLMACGLSFTALGQNFGTDILHLTTKTRMTVGVESNALGAVSLMQKSQGKSNHQSLEINLDGLDPNGIYVLSALVDDDTNLVDVTTITPDASGEATIHYQSQVNSNGKGKGHGEGNNLPTELAPVSSIQGFIVFNTNDAVVLTADLTDPNSIQYLLKKNLSTNSVTALLMIHATDKHTQFSLMTSGLQATNNYLLVVNGAVDQTVQTDKKGRFNIKSLANPPANALDIQSLELLDTSSNVVYNATLP